MAKILHKRVIAARDHSLQIGSIDELSLRIPTLRFEPDLTDVVVAGRARKSEVVGHQSLELTLVLFHPRLIPLTDDFFGCRSRPRLGARPPRPQEPRRSSQCASSRFERLPP